MASTGIYQVSIAGISSPVTVHLPTLGPGGAAKMTCEGWEYRFPGKVEGLIGQAGAQNALAVLAIQSCPFNPPLILGTVIPVLAYATLQEYVLRPVSLGVVEFELVFRSHGAPGMTTGPGASQANLLRIETSAQQIQTNLDNFGNDLAVTYSSDKKIKTVSAFFPSPLVEVTRLESGANPPSIDVNYYVSSTNNGPTPWDPGAPLRCWLCEAINAVSRDLGATYTKTYRFLYKSPKNKSPYVGGWDEVISYTLDDGSVPKDVGPISLAPVTGGRTAYQLYPSLDFMAFAFLF